MYYELVLKFVKDAEPMSLYKQDCQFPFVYTSIKGYLN